MFKYAMTLSLALTATLFTWACTNGAKTEGNTNSSQANRPGQSGATSPLLQQTLKGNIDRIYLNLSMARDAFKNNKVQEAVGHLQGANKEVDSALAGEKLRLRDEFEALKSAIDRTIGAVERREKDADSQLAELQVRIGAIKTNTP
jgi:hypothetical protein